MAFPTDGQFTVSTLHVFTSGDYADYFNYFFTIPIVFGLLAFWLRAIFSFLRWRW